MTMTNDNEQLPRSAAELEQLASYYNTSLRLPAGVIGQLKLQARVRHVRYTSHVRSILERAARGELPPEMADITERLERIERAVTGGRGTDDPKTA